MSTFADAIAVGDFATADRLADVELSKVERLAVHEAGHAVVARTLGQTVHYVTIMAPGDADYLGYACVEQADLESGPSGWGADRVALVSLAGPFSARRWQFGAEDAPITDLDVFDCSQDLRTAKRAAEVVHPADPDRYLSDLVDDAAQLVGELWVEILRVAEELRRHRTLSGRELDALVFGGVRR